jgi:uncharacterized protein involved in tolerance to divalent cations
MRFGLINKLDCIIVFEQNLAVCVNFLHNMTSIYNWKDELETESA